MRRGAGHQQARRRPRPRRAQRDQLLGQRVVEVVDAHGPPIERQACNGNAAGAFGLASARPPLHRTGLETGGSQP